MFAFCLAFVISPSFMVDSKLQFFHRPDALRVALIHGLCSVVVALLIGTLVFGIWYPFPYSEMAGGRELFLLIMAVDVVCGPLLTLVIYNTRKPRRELVRDIGLVVIIQLAALGYGLGTVWEARPLFLVHEVDRFKVIAQPDVAPDSLALLPPDLRPRMFSGPRVVAIRDPLNEQERDKVLFDALQGGRDYAERPEFYLPFGAYAARKSLTRAQPLIKFLERYPEQASKAKALGRDGGSDLEKWFTLPVIAREDWVAVLDENGEIRGFLRGDGF